MIVDEVRQSTLLLPTGALDVVQAKLLHGTACRHESWAAELGTDPDSDGFVIPAAQVVQRREIAIAAKAKHK